MKNTIKSIVACATAIILSLIPASCFYLAWSWCIGQVPPGEYSGLIKVGISLVIFLIGGGATAIATILAMTVSAALMLWLFEK